jgi:hypothetical protein
MEDGGFVDRRWKMTKEFYTPSATAWTEANGARRMVWEGLRMQFGRGVL